MRQIAQIGSSTTAPQHTDSRAHLCARLHFTAGLLDRRADWLGGRTVEAIHQLHQRIRANLHRFVIGAFHVYPGIPVVDMEVRSLGRWWRRGWAVAARSHVAIRSAGRRTHAIRSAIGTTKASGTTAHWRRRRRRGWCAGIDHRCGAAGRRRGRWLLGEGGSCQGSERNCGQNIFSHRIDFL